MPRVLFHAGMAKAGSTTVQSWIGAHAEELRRRFGITTVVLRRDPIPGRPGSLEVYRGGQVNSGWFLYRYDLTRHDPSVLDEMFEPLANLVATSEAVLISAESFGRLLADLDPAFLSRLEALASGNEVRVTYYLRPQHSSIEAAWRQWGFRTTDEPADYVERRGDLLDYLGTRRGLAAAAPHVSFEPRLLHRDVLGPDGIVGDFAHRFLGLPEGSLDTSDVRANAGLPLELVNLLRSAPPGWFWSSPADNKRLEAVKRVVEGWEPTESERIRRSRLILQHHCHLRFERDNQVLIDELDWPVEHVVPPVSDEDFDGGDLVELNELWSPTESESSRELLYRALCAAISPREP